MIRIVGQFSISKNCQVHLAALDWHFYVLTKKTEYTNEHFLFDSTASNVDLFFVTIFRVVFKSLSLITDLKKTNIL